MLGPMATVTRKGEGSEAKVPCLNRTDDGDKNRAAEASRGRLPVERNINQQAQLVICVLGIYACYLSLGMIQEGITTYSAEDGSRFSATLFLLWLPLVVNVICAFFAMQVNGRSRKKMPKQLYATAGSAYICAMVSSIEALKYVSFPTRELCKSCKMIPVMLFGVLFAKKRYGLRDYISAGLITAGIATFNLAKAPGKHADADNSAYGHSLLALSLILDGVTTSTQERLKAATRPTVHEMMFFMNAWALAILSVAAFASGQWAEGVAFISENPFLMRYILGFSLASAAGHNFVFCTITWFNPLVMTTIATTRKFFAIVLSVILYGHTIGLRQWGGVVIVFTGIGFEMRSKYQHHREKSADRKQGEISEKLLSPAGQIDNIQ